MDKEQADCTALISITAEALDDEMLETLLVSAQQVHLQICVEYAVRRKVVYLTAWCNTDNDASDH